jgi:hypothetical protein
VVLRGGAISDERGAPVVSNHEGPVYVSGRPAFNPEAIKPIDVVMQGPH